MSTKSTEYGQLMVLNGLGVHRKCAGNVVNLSWNFKECFDDVRPLVKNKPKDPKDRDSEMVWDVMSIEYNIKNTLPFTPENTQRLYDMRNGTCNQVSVLLKMMRMLLFSMLVHSVVSTAM
jgi:hypothetical protein